MKRLFARLSQVWRAGKGRPAALVLLGALSILLNFPDQQPFKSVRLALFDQYQTLLPRQPQSQPVVIVAIDESSLAAQGQWPWPRSVMAELINNIAELNPSAIGLDIIMPEEDTNNPSHVANSYQNKLSGNAINELMSIPSNDRLLAQSLAGAPTVLGFAGSKFQTSDLPVALFIKKPVESRGNDPLPWLNTFPYVLPSLVGFQKAAQGQAMLNSFPENGIFRRVLELSTYNSTITPGLELEMLRVAHAVPSIVVDTGAHGIEAANIGSKQIPLQENGEVWVHYDKPSTQRYISAQDLLEKGVIPPERIRGKMVLIGMAAQGLQDMITTPLGDRRPGVEVHAQLIESFEDGHFLTRPWWMHWAELSILLGGGLFLVWMVPANKLRRATRGGSEQRGREGQRAAVQGNVGQFAMQERRSRDRSVGIKPKFTAMVAFFLVVVIFGTGIALFHWANLLFDASSLFISLGIVFGSLLFSISIESGLQRKNAELALQNQRLKAAQIAGELDAARRIQLGTLPVAATSFPGELRFEIDAMLEPAKQVGGDLYDFFMMDERRLFFVIGDVSGKGLPASLFMVVTKALAKSAALRRNKGIGTIISMANLEMGRENPEMLFVTAVAGILDTESGMLELVNAGHDAPWRIAANGAIESVNGDGGPPLCVLDDFDYPIEHLQLVEGDTLLLLTDGITEAMNANKDLYSMERVTKVINRVATNIHPRVLVAALREDVRNFVGETEPSDDLTLLVLRWLGTSSDTQQALKGEN